MTRRGLVRAGLLLALLGALAAGHITYWYRPRPRPAVPQAGSPVAALLASDRYPAVLWIPYPHQNLGALTPDAEAYETYLASCARLVGLPPPVLPSFGGFRVVPSHEIALAADDTGRRFVVMARVYPALARFARLAGRLASNPWLSGGRVAVRGEPADVVWDGDVWIVRDVGAAELAAPAAVRPTAPREDDRPALAVLALHGGVDPFPAGRYRLGGGAAGVEVRSDRALPAEVWRRALAVHQPDLVLLVGAGDGARRGARTRALAIFAQARGSTDLPRAVSFNQRGSGLVGRPWEVPGADLANLAGGLEHEQVGDWDIAALGPAGLRAALGLEPRLEPLFGCCHARTALGGEIPGVRAPGRGAPGRGAPGRGAPGRGAPGRGAPGLGAPGRGGRGDHAAPEDRATWALVSDLDNTLAEVERIAAMLEGIPLIPARESERWRDAATVLAPVARRFDKLTIVIAEEPRAFRLVLAAAG